MGFGRTIGRESLRRACSRHFRLDTQILMDSTRSPQSPPQAGGDSTARLSGAIASAPARQPSTSVSAYDPCKPLWLRQIEIVGVGQSDGGTALAFHRPTVQMRKVSADARWISTQQVASSQQAWLASPVIENRGQWHGQRFVARSGRLGAAFEPRAILVRYRSP